MSIQKILPCDEELKVGHDEVEGLLFLADSKKSGSHFCDHVMNHIPFELELRSEQDVLSFFVG